MSTCPLCQAEAAREFTRVESFGYPLSYLQCGHCGFIFQDPEKTEAANPSFYAETYRKIYQASPEPTAKDLRQQELRASDQLDFLQAQGIKPKRVLDIGASSGLLLAKLREGLRAEVAGVEPGDAYRAMAQARGISVSPSIEALIASKRERFDLVSLMHVLEHLPDPLGSLRQIREELLSPDGFLLVEVPNFYAHDAYELAHLACYTPHSLRQMLRRAGFEVLVARRHGWPRSRTLPLYLGILAKPAPGAEATAVQAENGVGLKRSWGMLKRKILTRIMPAKTWLPLEGPQ